MVSIGATAVFAIGDIMEAGAPVLPGLISLGNTLVLLLSRISSAASFFATCNLNSKSVVGLRDDLLPGAALGVVDCKGDPAPREEVLREGIRGDFAFRFPDLLASLERRCFFSSCSSLCSTLDDSEGSIAAPSSARKIRPAETCNNRYIGLVKCLCSSSCTPLHLLFDIFRRTLTQPVHTFGGVQKSTVATQLFQ